MKKIYLSLLAVTLAFLSVTLTSCSNDDDSTPVNEQPTANVEGKWYYSKMGVSFMGQEQLQNYQHEAGCTKDNVELVSGGVFKDRDYSGSECSLDELTGTWSKTGNNVTVNIEGMAETWEIVSMTSSELKVRSPFTMEGQTYYDVTVFTKN